MAEELKVLKRSYLTITKGPLKDSMLNTKRWCVLVKDLTSGSTRMNLYRDERAASKGDPCKNSLNVASVVEAQRVTEKKQTFELLCPGVSHRFQATSEAEADDWVSGIKLLIVYRKDASLLRSVSLPTPNSLFLHHHQQSQLPYNHHPHMNLPTPPDIPDYLSTPPIPVSSHKRPMYLRSNSSEVPQHPFPSPNSSGDSSFNSASTGSMELHSRFLLASEGHETKLPCNGIRVRVKDNDKLPISGDCDLAVKGDLLNLYKPGQNVLVTSWHIGALRRYGVNKVCFTIDVGRNSATGASKFFFYTHQSSVIYSEVHRVAQRIEALSRDNGDKVSEPSGQRDFDAQSSVSQYTPAAAYTRLSHSLNSSSAPQFNPPQLQGGGHLYSQVGGHLSSRSGGCLKSPSSVSVGAPPLPHVPSRLPSDPVLKSPSSSLKHRSSEPSEEEEDLTPPPLPPKPFQPWSGVGVGVGVGDGDNNSGTDDNYDEYSNVDVSVLELQERLFYTYDVMF